MSVNHFMNLCFTHFLVQGSIKANKQKQKEERGNLDRRFRCEKGQSPAEKTYLMLLRPVNSEGSYQGETKSIATTS